MFWDTLESSEAEFAQQLVGELKDVAWVRPIIDRIHKNGGLTRKNLDNLLQLKDHLFELRFAYALHQAGVTPEHEIRGEAKSMIDFGFVSKGQQWAVEMMRLGETEVVKAATVTQDVEPGVQLISRFLSTNAEDPTQSLDGETFKAIRRICQKCERNGRPHKFRVPEDALQVLLVDFRTFEKGGDGNDMLHVALGADYVKPQFRCYWEGRPITGVFDEHTSLKGAAEMRQRVHFLGGNALTSRANLPRRPTLSGTRIFSGIPQPPGPPLRLGRCSRSSPRRAPTDGAHSPAFRPNCSPHQQLQLSVPRSVGGFQSAANVAPDAALSHTIE
jgi:hypothetical protein